MKISFSKYQGAGNDFVMINDSSESFPDKNYQLVSKLCDRRLGVGSDGLILLRPSKSYDFNMRYYNSDGHEGTMCGNGGRCLVAFARDCGCIKKDKDIIFDAIDGIHEAAIISPCLISLKMINVESPVEKRGGYHVETGSTHHVQYVSRLGDKNVCRDGRDIRNSEAYAPLGCNVNFVEDIGDGVLNIRTFERGVENETLACGTGSVATAITHHHCGHIYDQYVLKARGGTLKVSFKYQDGKYSDVLLEGPVKMVFRGEIVL